MAMLFVTMLCAAGIVFMVRLLPVLRKDAKAGVVYANGSSLDASHDLPWGKQVVRQQRIQPVVLKLKSAGEERAVHIAS